MAERIVLDPEEITGGSRVEVQISGDGDGPIEVRQEGVDFGDAEIQAYMADLGGVGSVPVDYDIPNRVISMKVKIQTSGDVTFAQARSMLQAKVAQIQAEGGWISRELPGVGTVYADLVNAKLSLPGDWMQAHRDIQLEATLSFEAIPDFYEAEWIEATFTDVEAGENHWRGLIESVGGDFPKGNRCKVVVTGDPDNDQRGLRVAFRRRHYSADPTAACFLQAQDLDPLDLASVVTLSGASGGATNNAVRHNNLGTGWTPVLGLRLAAGDYLTHTGSVRLVARVYSTSATPPELRAVWDVGDLVAPSENAPVQIPGASNFYLVDLGTLRLDRSAVGDHRWLGQIQGRGAVGGENVYIDHVELWPIDEHYAEVATPIRLVEGLVDHVARDDFAQSPGSLTGKTLPVGGAWTAGSGSDTTDFSVTADHTASRSAVSDSGTGEMTGRTVTAGTDTHERIVAGVSVEFSAAAATLGGLAVRYTDNDNGLFVVYSMGDQRVEVRKVISGTLATDIPQHPWPLNPAIPISIRTMVTAEGVLIVMIDGRPVITLGDADLATGGALESGKVGIHDAAVSASASTRDYRGYSAWVPEGDAAIFAGQAAELRTDGAFRASADGVGSGVLVPFGSHPRLPQGGPVEVMVATSRGDFERLPDSGLDDVSVETYSRRSWLTAPG